MHVLYIPIVSITLTCILFITVNHCLNTTNDQIIEIQSYVQVNALVGVSSIEEGSNLTLQVRQVYMSAIQALNH